MDLHDFTDAQLQAELDRRAEIAGKTTSLWYHSFQLSTVHEIRKIHEGLGCTVVVHPVRAERIRVDIIKP